MTKPTPKQDDPAQSKRFIDLAKELGLEEGDDIDAPVRHLAGQAHEPRRKLGKEAKAAKKR